jgi:hypothetical protein
MRRILFAAATTLLSVGLLGSVSAQNIALTVDCAKGQKVGDAIERADINKPLTINVRGSCTESVIISRDNVTIQGGTLVGPDSSHNVITTAAREITINSMTLSGGNYGVSARRQSEVSVLGTTIQNTASHAVRAANAAVRVSSLGGTSPRPCVIEHSGGHGISAEMGAAVNVSDCQIHDNAGAGIYAQSNSAVFAISSTISENHASGVFLEFGSDGILNSNTITSNEPHGVNLFGSAHANMNDNTITDNTVNGLGMDRSDVEGAGNSITDNKGSGVAASGSSLALWGGAVSENGGHGMDLGFATYALLDGTDVSRNAASGVVLEMNSTARVIGATVKDNYQSGISLSRSSKLLLWERKTDATGNVTGFGLNCTDPESSAWDMGMLIGSISSACTGY